MIDLQKQKSLVIFNARTKFVQHNRRKFTEILKLKDESKISSKPNKSKENKLKNKLVII